MNLSIGVLMRNVAWEQDTWRREDRGTACVRVPVFACLSFDGKSWVRIDSLANEPQNGQPIRPPE